MAKSHRGVDATNFSSKRRVKKVTVMPSNETTSTNAIIQASGKGERVDLQIWLGRGDQSTRRDKALF